LIGIVVGFRLVIGGGTRGTTAIAGFYNHAELPIRNWLQARCTCKPIGKRRRDLADRGVGWSNGGTIIRIQDTLSTKRTG
jgi:hypothetical protein